MKTVLFIGPTLPREELRVDAELRGPVARGDVLRAVDEGFERIAIIDGVFDQSLPVWHKELLWALDRGRAVWGAASMGALRAAELAPFGMRGVGRIFEAFRDGVLDSDDEVAVAHAHADHRFAATSEALVNIRVTLHGAVSAGVVDRSDAEALIALARQRFYPERSWKVLLSDAKAHPTLSSSADSLAVWLGAALERRIDQKAADARSLLAALAGAEPPAAPSEPFAFAYTEAFHELVRYVRPRL